MQKLKNIKDAPMPADEFEIAAFRLAVLEATEKICENILTGRQDIELTYQEFWVAIYELIDAVQYYQDMCRAFARSNGDPAQDCEFLLNVLMVGDPQLTASPETITTAVSLALYGMYNRFYSAAIMLVGVGVQKFPTKQKSIKLLYSKLSPNAGVPKSTTSTPQNPKIKPFWVQQEITECEDIQDGIK